MKTFAEVATWCAGAAAEFGDPAAVVCQLFFRWEEDLAVIAGDELRCGLQDGELVVMLGPAMVLPLEVELDVGRIENDELVSFGGQEIVPGVWALEPSLNAEGLIHAFVVLYGVPIPAPWERRIIVPSRIAVPA